MHRTVRSAAVMVTMVGTVVLCMPARRLAGCLQSVLADRSPFRPYVQLQGVGECADNSSGSCPANPLSAQASRAADLPLRLRQGTVLCISCRYMPGLACSPDARQAQVHDLACV